MEAQRNAIEAATDRAAAAEAEVARLTNEMKANQARMEAQIAMLMEAVKKSQQSAGATEIEEDFGEEGDMEEDD